MKHFLLLLTVFLFSISLHAQGISGVYTSDYSTYQDDVNPENNLNENNLFHIALDIEDDNKGMVAVQDSRTPDEILFFEIESFLDVLRTEERDMIIYQAHTVHLPEPKETKIIIYFKKDKSMNLMINYADTSQIYHDLTHIKKE